MSIEVSLRLIEHIRNLPYLTKGRSVGGISINVFHPEITQYKFS